MKVFGRFRQFFERTWRHAGSVFDLSNLQLRLRGVARAMNPFSWGERTIKVILVLFLTVALPVYLYLGFQPNIPADAASYPQLMISSIGLETPVEQIELNGRQLNVPDMIAGSYSSEPNKTLIVGHSSTVFADLDQIKIGQELVYDSRSYEVTYREVLAKENISMKKVLSEAPTDTIILMTCAGESLPNQDATHRLIITARAK